MRGKGHSLWACLICGCMSCREGTSHELDLSAWWLQTLPHAMQRSRLPVFSIFQCLYTGYAELNSLHSFSSSSLHFKSDKALRDCNSTWCLANSKLCCSFKADACTMSSVWRCSSLSLKSLALEWTELIYDTWEWQLTFEALSSWAISSTTVVYHTDCVQEKGSVAQSAFCSQSHRYTYHSEIIFQIPLQPHSLIQLCNHSLIHLCT